jgi:transposase InsO family protein
MQVHLIGQGVKGFYRLADYALRWGMIAPHAQRRLEILHFWQRHGLEATLDAFQLSRRTLYLWRAKLNAEGGNVAALAPRSTAPRRRRQRQWPAALLAEIRRLRTVHPNLAKEKLHVLLVPFAAARQLPCPSARTIGRLIADAPDKMRSRPHSFGGPGKAKPVRQPRLRKPKHFHAQRPGHCVALDTIELRAENHRRYVITCVDLHSHFAWAWATRSHASAAAAQFFRLIQAVFPFAIEAVLTDNGSEFQRHFATALADRLFTHWHTYPKTPRMNAHCERFNRTLQEECIDYHYDLLFLDQLTDFNLALLAWLSWYNLERPHFSLPRPVPGRKTPHWLSPVQFLHQYPQCNMCWPNTGQLPAWRVRGRMARLPGRHCDAECGMSSRSVPRWRA